MPCSLYPEDCGADHIAPVLRLRCTHPGQWTGTCPVCKRAGKFSLAAGTKGRRFVADCHYKPACPQAAIYDAILAAGISEACIPRGRQRRADLMPKSDLDALLAPMPAAALRLRLAMLRWDCDARTAAELLKMPERTYYRAVTALPKVAEHRRSALRTFTAKSGSPRFTFPQVKGLDNGCYP